MTMRIGRSQNRFSRDYNVSTKTRIFISSLAVPLKNSSKKVPLLMYIHVILSLYATTVYMYMYLG